MGVRTTQRGSLARSPVPQIPYGYLGNGLNEEFLTQGSNAAVQSLARDGCTTITTGVTLVA